ncbi:MAG: glycoside hydrolase family 18 protein, partial [Eubacteriaceae bacterium]|nr:glycoside hydrolase family 18 protein [Eubacteriaceae bacterium]
QPLKRKSRDTKDLYAMTLVFGVLIVILIMTYKPPVENSTRLVGYYAAWSAWSDFTPDQIDGEKLTHINYAFANIDESLKITLGYPNLDPENFKKLNTLKKKHPNLKTLISVGGWSWSGRFSDAALSDESRRIFADSCVDFIIKYGFDGVDLDWEYPVSGGVAENARRPEDKENFTLLLKMIRDRLDVQGQEDGKHYLLTIAGGAGSRYINNTELGTLHEYLDFANLMTYDFHGSWDKYTDFNAPLYLDGSASPQLKLSIEEVVQSWLDAGFPANKIVLGIPFYGHKYENVQNENNGLYQTYQGSSSLSYRAIAENYLNAPGYVRYFHKDSKVPWLFNGSIFISYDDEESIGLKAVYIKSKGIGGAMVWELSQDPDRILLDALHQGLNP